MFKLIFTIVSLTSTPATTPTTTSATNQLDFSDAATCRQVLADFGRRGDHTFEIDGVQVTLHFVGGRCVEDGRRDAFVPRNVRP